MKKPSKDGHIKTIEAIKEALSIAPVGFTILDASLNEIIFANQTAADMFGFQPNSLTRATLSRGGYVPIDIDGNELSLEELATTKAIVTGQPQKRVIGLRWHDGTKWFDVKAQPTILADGSNIVITAFADITEVMEAHHEREEAHLLQEQFISNVSHELRTPLGIIFGYSEMAVHAGLVDTQETNAWKQVYKSAARMRWLVENVLGVAKLEAGDTVKVAPFDLATAVGETVESMEVLAARNRARLILCEPPICEYVGNEHLICLAIANLVHNAIKFAAGGEVSIKLRLDDSAAVISVKDNGIGMSPETQAVIFERFRQGDGSDTRRYGGTGIGLHFVELVAKFHGGRVDVQSELGVGSVFSLVLPLGGE